MKNCIQCPHHQVVPDPDPNDWFCDDDCAVLCTLKKAGKNDTSYSGRMFPFKAVSVSCRPYQVERDSPVPKWCPLKKTKEKGKKS